jgi:hypothetical protein
MRTSYIGSRGITYHLDDPSAGQYRCQIGKYDLVEAVLFNGGGRVAYLACGLPPCSGCSHLQNLGEAAPP